jgi:hypothetical protein
MGNLEYFKSEVKELLDLEIMHRPSQFLNTQLDNGTYDYLLQQHVTACVC